MKNYIDDKTTAFTQTITSSITFISSITGIIKDRFLKVFPKEYFKNIYVDTTETFQEVNRSLANNATVHKIKYPSLTITPQLSLENPIGNVKNPFVSSPNLFLYRDFDKNYKKLLEDPDGKYKLYYTSDYITMNLRFKIITDSFVQATEIGYFLKSRFDDSMFKYLKDQIIQVETPKMFVNAIARIENLFDGSGTSIDNTEDLAKLDVMLAELGKTAKTIIRKKNPVTGNDSYFFGENQNLLTLFADLDIPEGVVRDNSVNGEYEVSFRFQITGWWPNAFILVVNKDKYSLVQNLLSNGPALYDEGDKNFYSTTIAVPIAANKVDTVRFEDSSGNIVTGHNIFHEVLTFDVNTSIKQLNFASLLQPDLLKILAYAEDQGYDPSALLYVLFRGEIDGERIKPNEDYQISLSDLNVIFTSNVTSDLVMDIYVNRAMIDALLIEMQRPSSPFSNERLLCTMTIQAQDGDDIIDQKIRVYAFKDETEMRSTAAVKALRVKTTYGIGYIGLVDPDNKRASSMRVCLGFNSAGDPIIKAFEKL